MPARQRGEQPRYRQLADALMGDISRGRIKVGETIPGEHELVARYQVSRHTVREALRRLDELGLIDRQQGIGTVVRARHSSPSYVQAVRTPSELMRYPADSRLAVVATGWAIVALVALSYWITSKVGGAALPDDAASRSILGSESLSAYQTKRTLIKVLVFSGLTGASVFGTVELVFRRMTKGISLQTKRPQMESLLSRESTFLMNNLGLVIFLFFVLAFSLAIVNKGSVGNVEAAAQKKGDAAASEWWNAAPQGAAPAELAPASGDLQAPAAPAPAPAGK